jgi:D-alanyl-D-alanine dipeptidase
LAAKVILGGHMTRNVLKRFFIALFIIALFFPSGSVSAQSLPDGFVYLSDVVSGIKLDMRYCTDNNFTGKRVEGYLNCRCIISKPAAEALKNVQNELLPFGLELKIFDAYRPQMAVDSFVRWASNLDDLKMKKQYYPEVDKANLFRDGYIAAKSSHSRGSTVDLTIIQTDTGRELDMGSTYDFFGLVSWPDSKLATADKRANRLLLRTLMIKYGFNPYPQELWHFTLANEPYPDTYYNFPVE